MKGAEFGPRDRANKPKLFSLKIEDNAVQLLRVSFDCRHTYYLFYGFIAIGPIVLFIVATLDLL